MIGKEALIYNYGRPTAIFKVEGETKTCWRVDGSLYRKATNRLYGGGAWSTRSIGFPTEEKLEEVKAKLRLQDGQCKIKFLVVSKLNLSQVDRILKIVSETKETKA